MKMITAPPCCPSFFSSFLQPVSRYLLSTHCQLCAGHYWYAGKEASHTLIDRVPAQQTIVTQRKVSCVCQTALSVVEENEEWLVSTGCGARQCQAGGPREGSVRTFEQSLKGSKGESCKTTEVSRGHSKAKVWGWCAHSWGAKEALGQQGEVGAKGWGGDSGSYWKAISRWKAGSLWGWGTVWQGLRGLSDWEGGMRRQWVLSVFEGRRFMIGG